MKNFSDPKGRPYAGAGPTVKDDGTPMLNQIQREVGAGSDTTGLSAGYTGAAAVVAAGECAPATMGGRSAGENSGTGYAAT